MRTHSVIHKASTTTSNSHLNHIAVSLVIFNALFLHDRHLKVMYDNSIFAAAEPSHLHLSLYQIRAVTLWDKGIDEQMSSFPPWRVGGSMLPRMEQHVLIRLEDVSNRQCSKNTNCLNQLQVPQRHTVRDLLSQWRPSLMKCLQTFRILGSLYTLLV